MGFVLVMLANAVAVWWFLKTGSLFIAGVHVGLMLSCAVVQLAWWLVRRYVAAREEEGA